MQKRGKKAVLQANLETGESGTQPGTRINALNLRRVLRGNEKTNYLIDVILVILLSMLERI